MRATSMPLGGAGRLCSLALAALLQGCPGESGDDVGVPISVACLGTQTQIPPLAPGPQNGGTSLQRHAINVSLTFPLFATAPPGDTTRLFVVEKGGVIKVVDLGSETLIGTFLDISNLVSTGFEQGLLGLAFDPEYTMNGRFYVSYTDRNGDSVIARYLRDPMNEDRALPAAHRNILTVQQPFANHNGGMIAFGLDDFLYIGLGDGGDANDPGNRAQNPTQLLGGAIVGSGV